MNRKLARAIFENAARIRNPSLWPSYDALKQTEWMSKEELETLQLKNCEKFLSYTKQYSDYYSRLFTKLGFDPKKIQDISEIIKIPEVKKETLIKHNEEIHANDSSLRSSIAETSGTSGAALSFKRDEKWDSLNRATMLRSYDWYDVKPWDKNGYLWGYNIAKSEALKVKTLDALQNRFRLFSYSTKEIEGFARKLTNASFLSGYSSMIYQVAKAINQNNLQIPNLKMIKGTSEMILDIYHRECINAFGSKMVSEYGAAESGLIAFECPHGSMHVNIENLHIDTNEKGEAIVTNFASLSFPIIRYNLRDSIILDDRACDCGRAHPVLREIQGRKGTTVLGHLKEYPALTFYYVFKNLALEKNLLINYKAIQEQKGHVTIYIEGKTNRTFEHLIRTQLEKYFGEDLSFDIEYMIQFEPSRKKQQYFESMINS